MWRPLTLERYADFSDFKQADAHKREVKGLITRCELCGQHIAHIVYSSTPGGILVFRGCAHTSQAKS